MDEKEKVFNKLKHGVIFVCPRCGSREFELHAQIEIVDRLIFEKSGEVCIHLSDIHELNYRSDEYFDSVYCDQCGTQISRAKLANLIKTAEKEGKLRTLPP